MAVAVAGYAEAVRGLAIGSSSEVGEPGARVRTFAKERPIQSPKRGVEPAEVPAPVCREEAVGDSDLIDSQPGVALQVQRLTQVYLKVAVRAGFLFAAVHAFSKEATSPSDDGRLDGCNGGAALISVELANSF